MNHHQASTTFIKKYIIHTVIHIYYGRIWYFICQYSKHNSVFLSSSTHQKHSQDKPQHCLALPRENTANSSLAIIHTWKACWSQLTSCITEILPFIVTIRELNGSGDGKPSVGTFCALHVQDSIPSHQHLTAMQWVLCKAALVSAQLLMTTMPTNLH